MSRPFFRNGVLQKLLIGTALTAPMAGRAIAQEKDHLTSEEKMTIEIAGKEQLVADNIENNLIELAKYNKTPTLQLEFAYNEFCEKGTVLNNNGYAVNLYKEDYFCSLEKKGQSPDVLAMREALNHTMICMFDSNYPLLLKFDQASKEALKNEEAANMSATPSYKRPKSTEALTQQSLEKQISKLQAKVAELKQKSVRPISTNQAAPAGP